jgi:divalent metal cation (Fe/Co/Zn/Cd) transporter
LIYLIFFGIKNIEIQTTSLQYEFVAGSIIFVFTSLIFYIYRSQRSIYKRLKYKNLLSNYKYYKKLTFVLVSYLLLFATSILLDYFGFYLYSNIIETSTGIIVIIILLIKPLTEFKNSFDQLVDKNLPEHVQFDLIGVIAENLHRMCRFNTMHTRQSGNDKFIELDIVLPYDYTIEQKYKLEIDLKAAILKKYPDSILRLYVVPCDKDCEFEDGSKCPIKRNT